MPAGVPRPFFLLLAGAEIVAAGAPTGSVAHSAGDSAQDLFATSSGYTILRSPFDPTGSTPGPVSLATLDPSGNVTVCRAVRRRNHYFTPQRPIEREKGRPTMSVPPWPSSQRERQAGPTPTLWHVERLPAPIPAATSAQSVSSSQVCVRGEMPSVAANRHTVISHSPAPSPAYCSHTQR